jgi:hypothetical protein
MIKNNKYELFNVKIESIMKWNKTRKYQKLFEEPNSKYTLDWITGCRISGLTQLPEFNYW